MKNKILITLFSVATIGSNFLTMTTVVKKVGFGIYSDIFFLSSSLILTLGMIFSWSLTPIIVPRLVRSNEDKPLVVGVCLFVMGVLLLFSPVLYLVNNLIFSNLDKSIIIILTSCIFFCFLCDFFWSMIQQIIKSNNSYLRPAIVSFVVAFSSWVIILLSPFKEIELIFLSIISQKVFAGIYSIFYVFSQKIKPVFDREYILEYISEVKHTLFLSVFSKSGDIIEKKIAVIAPVGFLSYFSVFQKIFMASSTVLVTAFSAPTMYQFSKENVTFSSIKYILLGNAFLFSSFSLSVGIAVYYFHDILIELLGGGVLFLDQSIYCVTHSFY
ncbi:hypothetical protein OWC53_06940 [Pectobacterium brasiliense]|uniref:hypothetical protein n=1 Tax=Pectobacterium brasiliense TaxID=180957 RepID=UPI00227B5C30|nr:hypothetical protein [Pectobacterium brasiliense]WGL29292.1 hypothetical protein OWC53_06940 [Pectobacterium brasiliense]